MKRPLGIVALLYGGGLLLGEFFQPPLHFLFTFTLALLVGALLLPRRRLFLIWVLIVIIGWTNFVLRTAVLSPTDLRVLLNEKPELATVRGTLVETPTERVYVQDEKESFRTMARLDVTAIQRGTNRQIASGRIVTVTANLLPGTFFKGQQVEVFGIASPPPLPIAEGLFDFRTYLRREQIYFQLKAESSNDWRIVTARKLSPPLSDRFKQWAKGALAIGLPNEDESLRLERALTLGDKTVLTDEVAEPFVRAATYHIFAVDGLRMAIIFGIFFALFRALRIPRAVCGILLIPLIWFYVALTGWPASAIRAAVMLTVVVVGWALKRPSDLLNSLFAAALIILIWQPQQLFQAGFQLSFFVVLCILLVLPAFDAFAQRLLRFDPMLPEELRPRWQRILHTPLRFILDLFFTSIAAWLGSIPLVAYYFHILTPVSAPANVVAVPLCALVLASNLVSLLLAAWFPMGAEIFNHAGWFLMECIRISSDWFATWPEAYRYVAMPSLFTIAAYYAVLLAIFTGWLFKTKWRVWKIAGLILLIGIWCVQWLHENSATRLTVLPLNGGSAIYCDASGWKNDLLIDCGNTNAVEFVMKPYLRAQGVNSLPCLVLTHGDLRQIGGVELLQSLTPVEKIVTSSARYRSAAFQSVAKSLEQTPEQWLVVNRGGMFGNWTVLHPEPTDHFPQADDNALVLCGEIHGTRILLLSDLGRPGQDALLERQPDLRAEIVVAGLPQQTEPLNDALLDAIQPKLIVIADSEFPAPRRAGRALRERLERRGIPVVYTRNVGAVKISLRKNGWTASAINGLRLSNETKPLEAKAVNP
jgi:competence protein ComEC